VEPVSGAQRPFLRVFFSCCHIYQRVYRDGSGKFYLARCPGCLRRMRIAVSPQGTAARDFIFS
jgi:hypothetical protein